MKRSGLPRVILFLALTGGMLLTQADARQGATGPATPERVTYRDRNADGKITTDTAEAKESPKGIELIANGKSKAVIFANDIIKAEPTSIAGLSMPDVLSARSLEEGKDPGKAATAYGELLKKAGSATDKTKRYLAFREAVLMTRVADAKVGADFETEAKRALEKWNALVTPSRKSWEIWPVSKNIARLQGELKDFGKAAAALSSLSNTPDLPKELKYEAQILEVVMQIRANNTLGAEGTTSSLDQQKDLPTGPLRDRVNVLKVAAKQSYAKAAEGATVAPATVKSLQDAIDAAKDPVAKGIGYTALGELYLAHNQTRDAMWAYLWVDVVYNQEKDHQILAVRRLEQIFETQGEKDRAEQYRDKVTRIRQ
ncbi:MAG: hypothetical protein ACRC8S_03480 [Fimbriiglobus sp.]